MTSQLSPTELCQILNMILGLPVKRSETGGLVRRESLNPCVVSTWTDKRRTRIEGWVDAILISHGVLLGTLMVHGMTIKFPKELHSWTNPGWFKPVHTVARVGTSRTGIRIGQACVGGR